VATVTTRLAIDELRSARARRERYVGEWLPEPILRDVFEISGDQIQGVSSIINPEKLGHLGPVADVLALLSSRQRP
jgi:DNA-directed RNA polymerase specialized sigma24 family protein